jgi:hypothetical protein
VAAIEGQQTNIRRLVALCMLYMQGRCTLLLGPPGSGKTTFLKVLGNRLRGCNRLQVRPALAGHSNCRAQDRDGKLQPPPFRLTAVDAAGSMFMHCKPTTLSSALTMHQASSYTMTVSNRPEEYQSRSFLQVSGSILYNGHNKDEFVVERTTAFVDQVRPPVHHTLTCVLLSLAASVCDCQGHIHVVAFTVNAPLYVTSSRQPQCILRCPAMSKRCTAHQLIGLALLLCLCCCALLLQHDNHIPNLSVAETVKFAHTCQRGYKEPEFSLSGELCRAKVCRLSMQQLTWRTGRMAACGAAASAQHQQSAAACNLQRTAQDIRSLYFKQGRCRFSLSSM